MPAQTPEDSCFRRLFNNCLQPLVGRPVEWPYVLRQMLEDHFVRLRRSDQYYKGSVFQNRDDRVAEHADRTSDDEEVLVYRLYAAVHNNSEGILHIGDMPVWLFSCQVPNQGKELSNQTKKRCADLLGLRRDGSLVVFECKGPRNRQTSPLFGLLEGLDYLGCLLTERNLSDLSSELDRWLRDYEPESDGFSSKLPADWPPKIEPSARHGVVVLAPQSYYELHFLSADGQPVQWWKLSDRETSLPGGNGMSIDFAVVDFDKGTASLLELPQSIPG